MLGKARGAQAGQLLHPSAPGGRAAGRGGRGGPQVRAALRIPPGPGRSPGGHGAQTMGRPGPYRGAQASPERGGRRRCFRGPPAPRPRPSPPAASSPRPRGLRAGRGGRKGLVGWPRRRHARPGRGNKGGMCATESPEAGRRWGPPSAAAPPRRAHCSRAHVHALNTKLTHPACAYQAGGSPAGRPALLRGAGFECAGQAREFHLQPILAVPRFV